MIKVSKWLNKRKNWRNWNYWITYKNGYARLLVLRLFPLQSMAYFRNIASLNLFYRYYFGRCAPEVAELVPLPFLILEGGLLVILIDCMIFLWPFLDVTRMSMSTVSSLAQLESGIFWLENAFLSPMILVALSLELTNIF